MLVCFFYISTQYCYRASFPPFHPLLFSLSRRAHRFSHSLPIWLTHQFIQCRGRATDWGGSRPTAGTAPFVERQIGRRGKSLLTQSHTLLITRGCKDDSAFQFFITLRKIELGIIRSTKQGGTTIKTNNNQFSAARTVQCGINPNTNKKICIFKWKRCLLIVWEQKAY